MLKKNKILIVEDEFIVANDLRITLQKSGYIFCGIASSVDAARKLIEAKNPDWVLLDIMLKGNETGIDLAKDLMQKKIPFLFISANTSQSILEQAKATQPYGFLVKPFREKDLLVMLDIARYRYELETSNITITKNNAAREADVEGIIGNSKSMQEVKAKIKVVANTDASVLILGDSGTGKEIAAHAIHNYSTRKEKPFVVVNCGALPQALIESTLFGHEKGAFTGAFTKRIGKFEQAEGGTIFLDEIGELPLDAQSKLLRVLQEKEVEKLGSDKTTKINVRIIAATNRNLQKEVGEGRFRLDLFYRLNVFPVELPPLRERMEDLEILTNHFIKEFSQATGKRDISISKDVKEKMLQYNWPGNIRELEHFIERNILLAQNNIISAATFPEVIINNDSNNNTLKTMEQMEREHIINVLTACNGKVTGEGGAAEKLQIPASTLFARMKKLNIHYQYK